MKLHYINLAPGGRFRRTGSFETVPSDVDRIAAAIDKNPHRKAVVHFHGGLVDEASGMGVAHSMRGLYDGVAHPVSFVWETGAVETLKHQLSDVYRTKLFQGLSKLALKLVSKKLSIDVQGGRGAARASSPTPKSSGSSSKARASGCSTAGHAAQPTAWERWMPSSRRSLKRRWPNT